MKTLYLGSATFAHLSFLRWVISTLLHYTPLISMVMIYSLQKPQNQSSMGKFADWTILFASAFSDKLRYSVGLMRVFFWYSLASSSDQKKSDFRQNISTMLGSFVLTRFTTDWQIIGAEPSVTYLTFKSLSSSIFIGFPLLAHSLSIVIDKVSFRSLPCTKGFATASGAQAA